MLCWVSWLLVVFVVTGATTDECRPLGAAPARSKKVCERSVAVLEFQPYHDETLFTAVRLAQAAGADCVTLLKVVSGYREFDLFVEMRKWAGDSLRVRHGWEKVKTYLSTETPEVLIVNTFEEVEEKYLKTSKLLDLAKIMRGPKRIVAGCHNLKPCLQLFELFEDVRPDLAQRTTPLVYHPRMADHMINNTKVPNHWTRPIVSVPFFFGPEGKKNTKIRNEVAPKSTRSFPAVKLLAVGSISGGRRNYGVLEDLSRAQLKSPVEIAVFGSGSSESSQRLKSMMTKAADTSEHRFSISFHRGNYSTLFGLAQTSDFVVPLIDADSPTFEHYVRGKLSSALAVATGFLVPVIGADSLLDSYGLDSQITHDAKGKGPAFANAVATALDIFHLDKPQYQHIKHRICHFRYTHFHNATGRLRHLLLDTTSST